VQARIGWCVAASAELEPNHPEKVLMVRREFAEKRAGEHLALVAAVLDACAFCQAAENHERVIETLARPQYVGVPADALRPCFNGKFDFGLGRGMRMIPDFNIFHGHNANEPSGEKVAWILQHMRDSGICNETSALNFALGRRIFRTDIFHEAVKLSHSTATHLNENESHLEPQSTPA
jgi:hypothetical protein